MILERKTDWTSNKTPSQNHYRILRRVLIESFCFSYSFNRLEILWPAVQFYLWDLTRVSKRLSRPVLEVNFEEAPTCWEIIESNPFISYRALCWKGMQRKILAEIHWIIYCKILEGMSALLEHFSKTIFNSIL